MAGPVFPKYEKGVSHWIIKGRYFNRPNPENGAIQKTAATNNVWIKKEVLSSTGMTFSEKYNTTGGDDTRFFYKMTELGYKIIWVSKAQVYESIDQKRANVNWILRRHFRSNNITHLQILRKENFSFKSVTIVLSKGLGRVLQFLVLAPLLPILLIVARKYLALNIVIFLARGMGNLSALLNLSYKEYK